MTLDLIATNVYNYVKAPANRGFSYIEIWMIGVQIPILVAIFEYAIILAMKKYQSSITEDQKRKVICFCKSRLIPALVTETLLKSFHLEGWPRYLQSDPLTLFDSVLLLCCLFTKGCPL